MGSAPGARPPGAPGGNLPAVVPGVQPIDVSNEITTMHLRHASRESDIAKGMREAAEVFLDMNPSGKGPTTLREFLDGKEVLDQLIKDSSAFCQIAHVKCTDARKIFWCSRRT
jgi:hypothetical protein